MNKDESVYISDKDGKASDGNKAEKICENCENHEHDVETISDTSSSHGKTCSSTHKYSKYELSKSLKQQLKHLPEILEFIQKLQKCIEKQKKKLKKIKCKEKIKTKSASTQTHDRKSIAKVEVQETNADSAEKKTLTEEITEAAQQALQHNGFVYEETSGLYYDYNSGYYYNAEYGLYYDGNTGTYMKYNQDTKEYEFHSQTDVTTKPTTEDRKRKQSKHKRKDKSYRDELHEDEHVAQHVSKKKRHKVIDVDLEDGECSDHTDTSTTTTSADDANSIDLDYAKQWPPCMRVIIEETSIAAIKQGSLHMITYEGGSIGREGVHSILLPEINNSKHHLKITFDAEKAAYFVTDVGSRNGTYLNGKRMASAKVESEPYEVVHGSKIQIGSTTLLCHIHSGTQTCGHCEPGLIQIKDTPADGACGNRDDGTSSWAPKVNNHKQQLKQLRKKFGLTQNDQGKVIPGAGYTDRAQVRREKVGSQNPHEKTQTASLNESIASNNKGFKLLAKMGWKEGQALGKESQGRLEPVQLVSNPGTSGMGSTNDTQVTQQLPERTVVTKKTAKQNAWMKAQERYKQATDQSDSIFDLTEL